jgi:hypothetical protein
MENPFERLFKKQLAARTVNLNASIESANLPNATCEVLEYDGAIGMEQWDDSLFMQHFEDATLAAPTAFFGELAPLAGRNGDTKAMSLR